MTPVQPPLPVLFNVRVGTENQTIKDAYHFNRVFGTVTGYGILSVGIS
jgi:hypothetical protein